ncbi:MAG TPA: hypothetical protein VLB76_12815 [Thermoanaerobaculia bacterium]|jgi:hypothetical protein|nr:hypothetical protein [Thermoanaerobaculia bacterium]
MGWSRFKHMMTVVAFLMCSPAFADRIYDIQYAPKADGGKRIVITWSADFVASSGDLLVTALSTSGTTSTGKVQGLITATSVSPPKTSFSASISFGGSNIPNEATVSLTAVLSATSPSTAPVGTASASSPPTPVLGEVTVNLDAVKEYFSAMQELDTAKSRRLSPSPPSPDVNAEVNTLTDRSLRVRVTSDRFVSVQAFAYPTDKIIDATGNTPFKSEEVTVLRDAPRVLKILNLSAATPYVIVLRDTTNSAIPAVLKTLSTDDNGNPIKTLTHFDQPTLAILERPKNKKNQAVSVKLQSTNAAKIKISIEEGDQMGRFREVAQELVEPTITATPELRKISVALKPKENYRVVATALSKFEDISSSEPAYSEIFSGVEDNLFTAIVVDVTDGLKFMPTEVAGPVTMRIAANVAGIGISKECAPANVPPSCGFTVDEVQTKLAAYSANSKGVTFKITVASADDTERSQEAQFGFIITPPANPKNETGKRNDKWKQAIDLTLSSVSSNTSLGLGPKAKSVGTFLLMLLKGII